MLLLLLLLLVGTAALLQREHGGSASRIMAVGLLLQLRRLWLQVLLVVVQVLVVVWICSDGDGARREEGRRLGALCHAWLLCAQQHLLQPAQPSTHL